MGSSLESFSVLLLAVLCLSVLLAVLGSSAMLRVMYSRLLGPEARLTRSRAGAGQRVM